MLGWIPCQQYYDNVLQVILLQRHKCFGSKTINRAFQFACLSGNQRSIEIVTIMAPLIENPNAPNEDGNTPIHTAAENGHTEIVKILAPLTENPNAPDNYGSTPIILAAENGHTEIVKILANSWLKS